MAWDLPSTLHGARRNDFRGTARRLRRAAARGATRAEDRDRRRDRACGHPARCRSARQRSHAGFVGAPDVECTVLSRRADEVRRRAGREQRVVRADGADRAAVDRRAFAPCRTTARVARRRRHRARAGIHECVPDREPAARPAAGAAAAQPLSRRDDPASRTRRRNGHRGYAALDRQPGLPQRVRRLRHRPRLRRSHGGDRRRLRPRLAAAVAHARRHDRLCGTQPRPRRVALRAGP